MGLGEDTGFAELGGTTCCEIARHWNVLAAKGSNDSAIINVAESSVEIAAAENGVASRGAVIRAVTGRTSSAVNFIQETRLN